MTTQHYHPVTKRGSQADILLQEQLGGLFGSADAKANRLRVAALQRKEHEHENPRITLASGYEPAYLR